MWRTVYTKLSQRTTYTQSTYEHTIYVYVHPGKPFSRYICVYTVDVIIYYNAVHCNQNRGFPLKPPLSTQKPYAFCVA